MMTLERTATEIGLGPVDQIPPGEGRVFKIGDKEIAVFLSRNGNVYATQPLCPHKSGPLVDGLMGGSTLVCPLHAWKFDLSTGEPLMGNCSIKTYSVRLNASGEILLTL